MTAFCRIPPKKWAVIDVIDRPYRKHRDASAIDLTGTRHRETAKVAIPRFLFAPPGFVFSIVNHMGLDRRMRSVRDGHDAAYNAHMSSSTRECMGAIEHLPEGATLILQQLSWDDYDALLEDLAEAHPRLRVTYDHGRVEIMSPLSEHEGYARFIDDLARAYADHLNLKIEKYGGTTWRRRKLEQGLEPDCCYYVTNADKIIGKKTIDLDVDPAPDLAVEIDISHESLSKFHIYAALKIREIWRYDGTKSQLLFYELHRASYREIGRSTVLPRLRPSMIQHAIEQSKTQGQTAALAAFRRSLLV
jgi:Uma2 family endonuclease